MLRADHRWFSNLRSTGYRLAVWSILPAVRTCARRAQLLLYTHVVELSVRADCDGPESTMELEWGNGRELGGERDREPYSDSCCRSLLEQRRNWCCTRSSDYRASDDDMGSSHSA